MASFASLNHPPFVYDPSGRPVKSILKQRGQLSRHTSSWLSTINSKLSSTESTANVSLFSAHSPVAASKQPRQTGLINFRRLIPNPAGVKSMVGNDSALSLTSMDDRQSDALSFDHELTPEELKRVRFSVKKLTTEYYPYKNQEASDQVATMTTDAANILSQGTDDHLQGLNGGVDTKNTTDGPRIKSPKPLSELYEIACMNKEEPMMIPFVTILRSAPLATAIRKIDLSNQVLSRRAVDPIADVLGLDVGLEELVLRNCGLEDETVKVLLHSLLLNDTVQKLSFSDNKKIKTAGFKYIAIYVKQSSKLQQLDLSMTNPDKKAIQYLAQAITIPTLGDRSKAAPSLSHLNMDSCSLKPQLLEILSSSVRKSRLRHLSLRNNRITSQGAIWLGVMLRDYDNTEYAQGLSTLCIDKNDIIQGVQYIAQALRRNQSLQSLSMQECRLDSKCCAFVGEALKYNRSLLKLNIGGNTPSRPTFDGITALKQALYVNRSLQELSLAATGLRSDAAIALAECIPENKSLVHLDLSQNFDIDLAGLMALSASVRMNHTLAFIDINIPPNDRDMAKIQSDIVTVCTRNAQNNAMAELEERNQSGSNSSLSSSTMITKTQATARLSLQERLAAVTRSKGTSSIRSSSVSVNSESTARTVTNHQPEATPKTNIVDTELVDNARSQVHLLEEMLAAEASQRDDMMDPIQAPGEVIAEVYRQCQNSHHNISNLIHTVTNSDHLASLLELNDKLTSTMDTYHKLFPPLPVEDTANTEPQLHHNRLEPTDLTATFLQTVRNSQGELPLSSSFEIGDMDDDDDDDLLPPQHPSPGLEHNEAAQNRSVET